MFTLRRFSSVAVFSLILTPVFGQDATKDCERAKSDTAKVVAAADDAAQKEKAGKAMVAYLSHHALYESNFPVDHDRISKINIYKSDLGKVYAFGGRVGINVLTILTDPKTGRITKIGVVVGSHSDDNWFDALELKSNNEVEEIGSNLSGKEVFGLQIRKAWQNEEGKEVSSTAGLMELAKAHPDNMDILVSAKIVSKEPAKDKEK